MDSCFTPANAKNFHSPQWHLRSATLSEVKGTEIELLEKAKIEKILLVKCPNWNELKPAKASLWTNKKPGVNASEEHFCGGYCRYVENDDVVLWDIDSREDVQEPISRAFLRAGPREFTYFDPRNVKAGIVTCGGLVPGQNNVIRDLVKTLHNLYGVTTVYGFHGGFKGIYKLKPTLLTLSKVSDINLKGGTILSTTSGACDPELIVRELKRLDVNQLYVIGGDGAMRGAISIHHAALLEADKSGHILSVIGVAKSIDNDIGIIDSSIGFRTAITEAVEAIESAKTEARCVPNGVGLVKLFGKDCGFIAAKASLASGFVDLCLIPEVPIRLTGKNGVLQHIVKRIRNNGHAVIVVSSGARPLESETDAHLFECKEVDEEDQSNCIGQWLKETIVDYCGELEEPLKANVKYIDPSYMIRSVEATASDSLYSLLLAQNSVHGAMAGVTGFTVGRVNNRTCYIPITSITKHSPCHVNPKGSLFEQVLIATGQPHDIPTI